MTDGGYKQFAGKSVSVTTHGPILEALWVSRRDAEHRAILYRQLFGDYRPKQLSRREKLIRWLRGVWAVLNSPIRVHLGECECYEDYD